MSTETRDPEAPSILTLPAGEHLFLCGVTGCGKTTLVRYLLSRLRISDANTSIIIVDPKFEWTGIKPDRTIKKLRDLSRVKPDRDRTLLVQLGPEESEQEHYDQLAKWIFERGRKAKGSRQRVYFDELNLVMQGSAPTPRMRYLLALYRQGRALGIGVMAGSQRPSGVPRVAQSESRQRYKFRLSMRDDQARMAEYMGPAVLEPPDYPAQTCHSDPHSFWYYRDGMTSSVQRVLKFER